VSFDAGTGKGAARGFPQATPRSRTFSPALGGTPVHLEGFDDGRGGSYLQGLEQLMLNESE